MTRTRKLLIGGGIVYVLGLVVLFLIFGSAGKNDEFQPQNEFFLEEWIPIEIGPLNLSITKAVVYLLAAAILTAVAMVYIARRMNQRPNRIQTLVEVAYGLMKNNITEGNMEPAMAKRWFTFVGTLFLFIWFSNMIGYIPLPLNTGEPVDIAGVEVPTFALYAATANISVTLILALVVFVAYNVEGVRAQGVIGYLRSFIPAGTPGPMKPAMFGIEVISNFVRIISLSVRLFANILAGHLLILFMAGGLAVLLGVAAIGWLTLPAAIAFFIFEVGLVASLQAFIFATLTAIYLGGATSAHH